MEPEAVSNISILQTDAMTAKQLKEEATALLAPLCELMDRARRAGLVLNFQIGTDGFGRCKVNDTSVVRPL